LLRESNEKEDGVWFKKKQGMNIFFLINKKKGGE